MVLRMTARLVDARLSGRLHVTPRKPRATCWLNPNKRNFQVRSIYIPEGCRSVDLTCDSNGSNGYKLFTGYTKDEGRESLASGHHIAMRYLTRVCDSLQPNLSVNKLVEMARYLQIARNKYMWRKDQNIKRNRIFRVVVVNEGLRRVDEVQGRLHQFLRARLNSISETNISDLVQAYLASSDPKVEQLFALVMQAVFEGKVSVESVRLIIACFNHKDLQGQHKEYFVESLLRWGSKMNDESIVGFLIEAQIYLVLRKVLSAEEIKWGEFIPEANNAEIDFSFSIRGQSYVLEVKSPMTRIRNRQARNLLRLAQGRNARLVVICKSSYQETDLDYTRLDLVTFLQVNDVEGLIELLNKSD